jgi:hypothetical protein
VWSVPKDTVLSYRVRIDQRRTASGLGPSKTLASTVTFDLDMRSLGKHGFSVLVKSASATGEQTQITAAHRVVGTRLDVDVTKPPPVANARWYGGGDDVNASDIAMLFVLLGPVLRSQKSSWQVDTTAAAVSWAARPMPFTVDHRVTTDEELRGLDVADVSSKAIANADFRLPLVVKNPTSTSKSNELIVNQLFDALFSDIHNPVQGIAAAIASIPLSIVAPFLALGQAIGNLFGSHNASGPSTPSVDLSGPLQIESRTKLWTHDGRVLAASGMGTMHLAGTLPSLPGRAAQLSGKTLHLDAAWTITETMLSPFPKPVSKRNVPLTIGALIAVLLAAALSLYRMRRVMRPR